jgi:asparagine synthase (glutamine-hydrolysing)
MSGICGIVNFDGAQVELEDLQKMARAAAHRGPDGIHYWRNGPVGLVNLALNITPESLRERQPLVGSRGELVLTADARVDNRDELIRTLTAKGFLQDKSPTDADVILAAYQCWGETCPAQIVGDFAFVIWDTTRRRLFAAREPLGMRALYYRLEPHRVLFATEIKQILAVPGVPARIFEPAVGAFLAGHGGPPEWTLYEGILQLPPAHALTVDASGHNVRRYWEIEPDYRIEYTDEDQYAEHFAEIFKEAVRCRLRTTKPVGIFLSGGMDSGSVAATAGWLLRQGGMESHPGFRAYCWAFEDFPHSDERHISDGIVDHYDLPVAYIPADTAWPLKDYPRHGPDRDDPYLPYFRVLADRTLERARADGVGSMFTGGLGDIMIGGAIFDYLDQLRQGHLQTVWDDLLAHGRLWSRKRRRVVRDFMWEPLLDSLLPPGEAGWLGRALHRPQPYPEWVRSDFARRVDLEGVVRRSMPQSPVNGFARSRRYQMVFWPASTRVLVAWEISNAHFGLGDADPFSDRRLARFVLAIPQRIINRAG